MIHEVVIVGGGFGGVGVAKRLAKEKNIHITLIDKNSYHTFYPSVYEIATAIMPDSFVHCDIGAYDAMSSAAAPFDEIFFNDHAVTVVRDEIREIDYDEKKIIGARKTYPYDTVVVAPGAEISFFDIPGLKEYALPLQTIAHACAVRNAVSGACANHAPHRSLRVVVGGGGFTGCEYAGELIGFLKHMLCARGRGEYLGRVIIVDAAPTVLAGASAWAQKKASARLRALGVELVLGKRIDRLEEHKIFCDGKTIDFDIFVWAGGVRAKRLPVDDFLRIIPREDAFAAGDSVGTFPMTASVAIRQAPVVAQNIEHRVFNKNRKLKAYRHRFPGFIISLGGRYALFERGGFHFSGFLPWVMKEVITLHYWISLLGIQKGFGKWRRGVRIFIKND